MLLQQLTRVKEIDDQISDLHDHLTNLYNERADLMAFSSITPEAFAVKPSLITTPATTPKALYTELKNSWQSQAVSLPTQKTLQTKLQKALRVIAELTTENPQLAGHLHVVAVPPFKQLKEIVVSRPDLFRFAELDIFKHVKKSQTWSLVVVAEPAFSTEIPDLGAFISAEEYMHGGYDCRGLGVQELLSAELQGIPLHEAHTWTLLLKDMHGDTFIPCATLLDNRLNIDIDDAHGLLGTNYLCPAIAI